MKINLFILAIGFGIATAGCNSQKDTDKDQANKTFASFENDFLDAYWKQYPSKSIFAGYGKYYAKLVIPDSTAFAADMAFSGQWIDLLTQLDYTQLNDNNKISFNIIQNQLESDVWYNSVFRPQDWDASMYNIGWDCDYILNQPYASLDERLSLLSAHLEHADDFYRSSLGNLRQPTKEHVELSIMQNQGSLSVFGPALSDSIKASHLSKDQKDELQKNIAKTIRAMNGFIAALKAIAADKNQVWRSFRIGKKMFAEKFKYDLALDFTPEQLYQRASSDKQFCQNRMFVIAQGLWDKYCRTENKPSDSIRLVQMVLDKIQMQHALPKDFFDSLTNQVHRLKRFIIEKKLFELDTVNPPIQVRIMPEYERGVTVANAEFTPPYQKKGVTYYNIDDLTRYPPGKAESALREYNNYASQLLSIHEAVPGHCVQGIYNNKKSPDMIRAVFGNGAMIEGWAVYTESMMIENGWGGGEPEMELALYKWKIRELANVIIDYDIQCLDQPKETIIRFLVNECFQTQAQADEKYHRATVSQVQLCSYYAGASAIFALREEYKKKMGDRFSLEGFHERFLSFGSSPVKYIRERMLQ